MKEFNKRFFLSVLILHLFSAFNITKLILVQCNIVNRCKLFDNYNNQQQQLTNLTVSSINNNNNNNNGGGGGGGNGYGNSGSDGLTTTILSCKLRTWNKTNNNNNDNLLFPLSTTTITTSTSTTTTKTININKLNLQNIKTLYLRCIEQIYLENLFNILFLNNLINLNEIKIDNCLIKLVPVIPNFFKLKSLIIRTKIITTTTPMMTTTTTKTTTNGVTTGIRQQEKIITENNSDSTNIDNWDLSIKQDSFNGFSNLINLELPLNNIKLIKKEYFQQLYSLKRLNLTKNLIQDIKQLGDCCQTIEIIDLSNNIIKKLYDDTFMYFQNVHTIQLNNNLINNLYEYSLRGLDSLQIINLSNNNLTHLHHNLFKYCHKLLQIYLNNNFIEIIPVHLFHGLIQLESLDLTKNKINFGWNNDIFSSLLRLISLNLSYNLITKLDNRCFHGLWNLQILNIEYNLIRTISDYAFDDLKSLRLLILTGNKIKHIGTHNFASLLSLNQIFLDINNIDTITIDAFKNLRKLNELSLNENKLKEIPNAIKYLTELKSLDLGNNLLTTINSTNFKGLNELLGLRLAGNLIEKISSNSFTELKDIQVLNLASNKLTIIERTTFLTNNHLKALRLDNNNIKQITGILTQLKSLVWLNISDNNLNIFDYNDIPDVLEWIELKKNNITIIENSGYRNKFLLRYLDVSYNKIKLLKINTIPNTIETLIMKGNLINEITDGTFINKKNLIKFDITDNNIRKINIGTLSLSKDLKDIPEFYLSGNPIHCDCTMEWLQKINHINGQYPHIIDLDKLLCTMELKRKEIIKQQLINIKVNEFLCGYTIHCFALCHCCDFDACDCKMTCPDGCTCYYNHPWSTNIVNCGYNLYKTVPDRIPMDATIIYLDGNNFIELENHVFIGKKRLNELYLNNSNINSLQNRTFYGLTKLKILHLEFNHLEQILICNFDLLIELRELYLNNNKIKYIEPGTFTELIDLRYIILTHNHIKDITVLDLFPSYINLNIFDGNRWECNCDLWEKYEKFNDIECINGNSVSLLKTKCLQLQDLLTSLNVEIDPSNSLIGGEYIPMAAAILVGIMSTILVIILLCTLRTKLRLWIYAKYGVRIFNDQILTDELLNENEKLVDAHIIFSNGDSDFMYRVFAAEIQHTGYNISLHQNDMSLDDIEKAYNLSKRLIVLISLNFIQDWSDQKFCESLEIVINKIRIPIRRHKIIVIIAAPLELIMSSNEYLEELTKTSTVLFWGEKRFWDKFRYSMPDINCHKTVRKKDNNNKKNRNSNSDKRMEYSYVTMIGDGDNKQYQSQTTNHLYSTIPETSNGRAYFV